MSTDAAYTLRPMAPPDANAIQALWRVRFGGPPSTQENWIEAALDSGRSARATVVVPRGEEEVVGFGILEVGDEAYIRRYLSLDAADLDPPLARRNGVFHMYCVRTAWEGRGIGSALYAHHLGLLAERAVPMAFGIAWHRPHTVDSRVLFEKNRFARLATVERYYGRFEERPHCPDCTGSCTCTASLYARSIDA